MSRTPEIKYEELIQKGRSPMQIRAVAVARDDRELQKYVEARLEEDEF